MTPTRWTDRLLDEMRQADDPPADRVPFAGCLSAHFSQQLLEGVELGRARR